MDLSLFLLVVVAAVAIAGFAKRFDLQVPLVLLTIGSAASFIPGLPQLELSPDLILGVVLPPLLYSAALGFSFTSFTRNLGSILRLGVGMVLVTTFVVGYFAYWAVPELTLGAALVLGAVVAPPDAVAAVAVGRKLGLPNRMMSILTGESLVNDAAALTLFTLAVASVTGRKIRIDSPFLYFGYEIAGGVLVGLVLAYIVKYVRSRIEDPALETVLGILTPFAAYLAAEEIHASGVLAVVTAGFVLGAAGAKDAIPTRMQERQVWPTVDLLLETFVFAYMGLQLKFVIDDVRSEGLPVHHVFFYAGLILLLVIAVRPAWIFVGMGIRTVIPSRKRSRTDGYSLGWRQNLVISWAGMRGVVTLAAASGVPLVTTTGAPFPGRGVIQATAFVVAVGTLLIQGLTLPLLIRRIDVADPGEDVWVNEQMALARRISHTAVQDYLEKAATRLPPDVDDTEAAEVIARVRRSVLARMQADETEETEERTATLRKTGALFDRVRRNVLRAQRSALLAARDAGDLDDEILRTVLDGLDIEQAAAETRIERFGNAGGRSAVDVRESRGDAT